ncbi:serine/threonine protein kinase [Streptomyces sp. 4N509B]|uniref:serine/threonine protein kinase n=1 Tax=Streptomyces sp. 4N509B TaxID=3457413 RepID=UPI003FD1157B
MEDLAASDPRTLGRYRACAVLGEGGMGRVLLATGPRGALVAIKRVHDHLAGDHEFRKRFRREVAASRRVTSEHTAPVVDADTEAAVPWLASQFVHGPSLRQALDAVGSLPQDAVLRLAAGLAAALRDIHAAGLVHRDLSPSNVLLADDGPRVIDFGIVRAAEGQSTTHRHTMTTTVTHTGMVIGAPGFMSPEQAEGRDLTSASDVFALGTVLVLAATGANPFEGRGIPQTLYNVVHATPDLGTLPAGLRRVVEPCLAKDPEARPDASGVLDLVGRLPEPAPPARVWPGAVHALTEAQRDEVRRRLPGSDSPTVTVPSAPTPTLVTTPQPPPSSPTTPAAPPTPPPPARPRRASPAGALLTALAIVAAVVFAVAQSSDDSDGGSEAGATPDPSPSWTAEDDDSPDWDPDADIDDTDTDEATFEPEPDPEPTTPEPDPVELAVEGDCFHNHGTMRNMELEPTTCGDGAFEAVSIIDASTDPDDCQGTEDADWAINYPSFGRTLCLSYHHANGTAYHAEVGDCVYGPKEGGSYWTEQDCQTGNFTVVGVYDGRSSWDHCDGQTWHHGRHYTVGGWPALNRRLCLTMNYPDDAGRASVDHCMVMSESGGTRSFHFAADCASANVIVTGRTSTYNDPGFCGNDGSTWWQNPDFPDLGYTMCWRWL